MSKVIKSSSGKIGVENYKLPSADEYLDNNPLRGNGGSVISAGSSLSHVEFADDVGQQQAADSPEALEQAKSEASTVREEARLQGHTEGLLQGKAEAEQELQQAMQRFAESLDKLIKLQEQIVRNSEGDIIDLTLEIAKKVISAELDLDPGKVRHIITEALRKVGGTEGISVKINPADYEYLKDNFPDFLDKGWLTADSSIQRGGAVIESPTGLLDAQIHAQLLEIEKSLKHSSIGEAVEEL